MKKTGRKIPGQRKTFIIRDEGLNPFSLTHDEKISAAKRLRFAISRFEDSCETTDHHFGGAL